MTTLKTSTECALAMSRHAADIDKSVGEAHDPATWEASSSTDSLLYLKKVVAGLPVDMEVIDWGVTGNNGDPLSASAFADMRECADHFGEQEHGDSGMVLSTEHLRSAASKLRTWGAVVEVLACWSSTSIAMTADEFDDFSECETLADVHRLLCGEP